MKRFVVFLIALAMMGCNSQKLPIVKVHENVRDYSYVYVAPTAAVTSDHGVNYSTKYGAQGSAIRAVVPSDEIADNLVKRGYTILPSVTPELADKTLVVSYKHNGSRQMTLTSYASCITVQMLNARTNTLVASCETEGIGSDETAATQQAISNSLDEIFSASH